MLKKLALAALLAAGSSVAMEIPFVVAARILGTTPFWPAHTCVPTPQPTSLSAIELHITIHKKQSIMILEIYIYVKKISFSCFVSSWFKLDVYLQNHY
jgi:hypothetical protein